MNRPDLPGTSAPRVAVVIVNLNGRAYLETCFSSLAALDYPADRWQPVVVDNGSTDDSIAYAQERFPGAQILPHQKNLGFAGGNNAGIRWALDQGFEYVALLNNDTRVEPSWLSALVREAEAAPDVAACASRILTWDGKLIEYAGTVFYPETTHGGYTDEPNDGRYASVAPAAYPCGAACLLRAAALRQIGLLDEDYFCYHEDVDWGIRAWLSGWRVLYVPDSVIYHLRGGSSTGTQFRDDIGPRNALMTLLKCYEWPTLVHNGRQVLRIYTSQPHLRRGLVYNLGVLPRTLLKRRTVQRLRRRSDAQFWAFLEGPR